MSTQEVRVTLATTVLTVTGTVNGAAYDWVRSGDTWTATVAAASDGKYAVALTIVDVFGTVTTQSVILYYGLHLVRDRTQGDVTRVGYLLRRHRDGEATDEETAELLDPTLKGAYNHTDLNRVGAATAYLSDQLHDVGGVTTAVTARRDWGEEDIPTRSDMETYLADVAAIRGAYAVVDTAEVPADMDGLTWREANDIEQILWDVNEALVRVPTAWRYAGEYYAGE